MTRLQRPKGVKDLILPDKDVAALEKKLSDGFLHDPEDTLGQRATEWSAAGHLARIFGQVHTSWIVDPADGQIHSGRRPANAGSSSLRLLRRISQSGIRPTPDAAYGNPGRRRAADPEPGVRGRLPDRPVAECRGDPVGDEHDVRIVRIGGHQCWGRREALDGDSIGHYEGDVLVVETTNFNPLEEPTQPRPDRHVARRDGDRAVQSVSATEILYEFTVDDPKIFTQVWRAQALWTASSQPIYEFACHEGNYSLRRPLRRPATGGEGGEVIVCSRVAITGVTRPRPAV